MTKSGDIQNPTVFGVFLQDERSISNKLLLGSIILSKNDMCSSCINLRQMINKELQSIIPQRFNFLTKEGWPLTDEQELKLKIYNIIDDQNKTISIKKTFDKPRIGIVNTNNDCIGFIYIDQSSKLFEIRQSINNLLNEVVNQQVEYLFIDKNGWPILLNQENELTLIDLVKNHCICIKPKIVSTDLPYTSCNSISLDDNKINKYSQKRDLCSPREEKSIESEFKRRSKTLINRTNTFVWRRKDKKKANTRHVIMLSYVRNEASIHAIKLKKYLVELGFSVFLDVHEIETGTDWADVLNEAVNACQVFVPLITPMYGKTQWTNREVKLADMLDKIIIPVNFLEKWPPSCLSIQFATIQVIHWKPKIEDSEHVDISPEQQKHNDSNDIRFWPDSCIKQVSVLIAKQTPKFEDDTQVQQHKSSFLDKSPTTNNSLEDNITIHKSLIKNKKPNNNQIVISAHPNQKNLADNLRKSLQKENYQVWCSTDATSTENLKTPNGFISIDYPYPETPDSMISLTELQSLSTISESAENQSARANSSSQEINEKKSVNNIFNKNDLFIQNNNLQIVSSSSTATSSTAILSPTTTSVIQKDIKRPTSLPITKIDNNHFFTYEKRQIKRLPSQISEISNYNTQLTPEKLERLIQFQDKVQNSKLVIIMISDAYFKSTTSKNHVYYCEHRKKMLLIKTDQTTMPTPRWFSNLVADEAMITQNNPKFLQLVKRKIDSKQLISSYHNNQSTTETKLQFLMKSMKKGLPQAAECCVYFLGSSKHPISSKSEKICKALGVELSKIKNIVVVSCGYGIGNLVAKSFYDNKLKKNSEPNLVHIIPHKDSGDFSHICKQNKDKSFDDLDYGKTLFIGESMKERDKVVAKLLNTCVLIEGDLETVYQAEEFIWSDHHVIPVISSGGAASGLFGLNAKCFNTPVGVEESDWSTLSDQNSTPEEIAKSICRIIIQLKKSILNQYILTLEESSCGKFKKSIRKKRIDDKLEVLNRQLTEDKNDNLSQNSTPEKVLPMVENFKQNDHTKKNRWSKMQKYIWLSRRK